MTARKQSSTFERGVPAFERLRSRARALQVHSVMTQRSSRTRSSTVVGIGQHNVAISTHTHTTQVVDLWYR